MLWPTVTWMKTACWARPHMRITSARRLGVPRPSNDFSSDITAAATPQTLHASWRPISFTAHPYGSCKSVVHERAADHLDEPEPSVKMGTAMLTRLSASLSILNIEGSRVVVDEVSE